MMKLAIFGRITDNTDINVLKHFFAYLKRRKVSFMVYAPYVRQLCERMPSLRGELRVPQFSTRDEIAGCKFLFSFGGDGTVLETFRFAGDLIKPVLGVNFGRLGYLTSITQKELIPATESILKDVYRIDERAVLSVVSDPPGLFGDNNFGVNELAIHKSNTNEMITVHTYINGEFLNSYWGDGLIVATPTGSTAYSLSCGGPIIFPSAATFVLTPVAPHSLTIRPVIIPDDWVVSFEIESRSGQAMVSLDTRTKQVKAKTAIAVRRAEFKVKLLRVFNTKYVSNLRRCLMWGSDNRNE